MSVLYLEGDAAYRQVRLVLQHVQILGHEAGGVHEALRCLRVVVALNANVQ